MPRWYTLAYALTAAVVLAVIPVARHRSMNAQPLPAGPVGRARAEVGALPGKQISETLHMQRRGWSWWHPRLPG